MRWTIRLGLALFCAVLIAGGGGSKMPDDFLQDQGGFEDEQSSTEVTGWSMDGRWEIVTNEPLARTGDDYAQHTSISGAAVFDAALTSDAFPVTPNDELFVSYWLVFSDFTWNPNPNDTPIRLEWSEGGAWTEIASHDDSGAANGVWGNQTASFTPTLSSVRIRFVVDDHTDKFGFIPWGVDDVTVGDDRMAIKLGERVEAAIESTLQTNLGAALTAIDVDRGDGITMADPDNAFYFKRPKSELAGSPAYIEIFCGEFELSNADTTSAVRYQYEIPFTVRCSFYNVDAEDDPGDVMRRRMWRYASGVAVVLAENQTLGGSEPEIQFAQITRVVPYEGTDSEDEDKAIKARIQIDGIVRIEEEV